MAWAASPGTRDEAFGPLAGDLDGRTEVATKALEAHFNR
jgi:hypothetical protein